MEINIHVSFVLFIYRQIQDPASQRLVWYKPPLAVLVIKKVRDSTVLSPFVQLVEWLIQVMNPFFEILFLLNKKFFPFFFVVGKTHGRMGGKCNSR